LERMYDALEHQYTLSRAAIADLEDEEGFEGLVQGLLRANWGMDWRGWWDVVEWNCWDRGRWGEGEREVVLGIVERWLGREEVRELPEVKGRVEELKDFLGMKGVG
jgi:hypothetical protein